MKTVFDKATRDELKARINSLNENSTAVWGKMTAAQMAKHCAQWDDMALGNTKYKQSFMGKIFGKMALKDIMADKPLKKNMPTVPSFKMTGKPDLEEEKKNWIKLLDGYGHYSNEGFIHPFFGVMTKENIGKLVYKHADHHLQQFNS